MKLISVVICTYNGAKYIGTQLSSIINQTYQNLEIIIVDDNSKDNTLTIINDYAIEHQNIKVHAFNENVGYVKNFERGINLAKGELIALSDQDDWWEPNKIEVLAKNISNKDLVYCDSKFVDKNLKDLNNSFSKGKNMLSSNNPLHFTIDNCVSGHATLFTKTLFNKSKPFPNSIPHDWWLTFIASTNNGLKYIDESLVKYRHHDNNVIINNSKKKSKTEKTRLRKLRVQYFYTACPETLVKEKIALKQLNDSYQNFSLLNNFKRVSIFYKHQDHLLKILKKSPLKKCFIIFNMFFKLK